MQGKKLNKTCFLRMMTAWMLAVALAVPSVLAAETGQPPPAADAPALLAATAPSAAIISPQADPVKHPTITITQTLVQDDFGAYTGVVELALTVKTEVGEPFRSVGLNLVYDPYLIPCDWTGQGTAVTLGANQYATNLPALKSDAITAGMAMAGGTKGYLYLGAMADLATDLDGKAPLALVRFKYADKDALKLGLSGKIQYAKAIGGHAVGADANLISFVSETDPDCYRGSQAPQQLWYESGDKSYYYNNSTVPPVGTQIPGETPGITAPCPVTHGKVVYSKAGAVYSFETNRLPTAAAPTDKGVYMAEAEGPTQNKSGGGVSLSDIVTVVFFDWDDSFLGATAVPRGRDARKIVDDFVRANMVHPDLRTATEAQLKTKERQYTYRGEYPCEGPGVGATFPDGSANPGSKYALTNKLDYATYMTFDDEYLYDDCWVEVTPQTLSTTWTTIGSGALKNATTVSDFDFKTGIINLPNTQNAVYVKGAQDKGARLDGQGTGNTNVTYTAQKDSVSYSSYGGINKNGGSYSIKFTYKRINAQGYGVTRTQMPALKVAMMPDILNSQPIYMNVAAEGQETISVELVPSKQIASVTYQLVETYGLDFYNGAIKDPGSQLGIFKNYQNGTGTDGFVKFGTLGYISELAYTAAHGGVNGLGSLNEYAYRDATLRDYDGSQMADSTAAGYAAEYVLQAAKVAGDDRLDLYQMQRAIFDGIYLSKAAARTWYNTEFVPIIH